MSYLFLLRKQLFLSVFILMSCLVLVPEQEVHAQSSLVQNLVNQWRASGKSADELRELSRRYNITLQDLMNMGYTATDLKNAGFTADELKNSGVTIAELKAAGFTANDLKDAGFTIQDLRNSGFTIQDLTNAGYSLRDLTEAGVSISDLRANGVSTSELRASGFTASELKQSGLTDRELFNGGYTLVELKNSGSTAASLRGAGANVQDLLQAGFTVAELKTAGVQAGELRSAGISFSDLRNSGFTAAELMSAGASAQDLKSLGYSVEQMRAAGVSIGELKNTGATASELKNAGVSATDLKQAGFTTNELKTAGFTTAQLKEAGVTLAELKESGVTIVELKGAGFSALDLKNAGYTAGELKSAGVTNAELLAANFSALELKNAGVDAGELKALGLTISDLKNAGFSDDQLLAAGFTQADLLASGSTIAELLNAGATPQELLENDQATIRDLINAGVTVEQLRQAGVNNNDLLANGITAKQLLDLGTPVSDLVASGVSIADLKSAGVSTQQLLNAGVSADALFKSGTQITELKNAGVSTSELLQAGARPSDLLNAGVPVNDLVENGVPTSTLLESGVTSRQLLDAGVTSKILLDNGISARDLLSLGVSAEELIGAGVNPVILLNDGASTKQLVEAGVSASDLRQAGISAEELKSNGVNNNDLVRAGFPPSELMQAGLTTAEMLNAGMAVQELKAAGLTNQALINAGAPVSELKNAGVTIEEFIALGLTDQQLTQAGYRVSEIQAAREAANSGGGGGTTPSPIDLDDLINSEIAAQLLNDGDQCVQSSGTNSKAVDCRSSGSVWNCDMNICYTSEYRAEVLGEGLACYQNESNPDRQNSCVENVKTRAVRNVAEGGLCDSSTNEAIQCAGAGKIYNCNVGQCLTIQQNHNLSNQVVNCYKLNDPTTRESCMRQTEVNIAVDLLTNCDDHSAPGAIACRRDSTRSWNCLANACLDKSFNDGVTDQTKSCIEGPASNKDQCLEAIKLDVVRHIASGEACDKNTTEAKSCQNEGKIFNCNVGYCLTENQNQELTDKTVRCEQDSTSAAQRDQCINDLKNEAIRRVASGEMCDQTKAEAMMCSAQGKAWNCNVDACLTLEENLLLTDNIVRCETQTDNETDKKDCYAAIKENAIRHIASGGNCDPTTPEYIACAAEEKTWNCNVNYCLTSEQNEVLTDEITKCQLEDNVTFKNQCMAELEDRAIDFLMRACDISSNQVAQQCQQRGRVWNCQMNICLSEEDQARLVTAVKNCNAKPTEQEQKECHAELEDFSKMADNGEGLNSDAIKMPNNPTKMIHGGLAAGGMAATLLNMAPNQSCYSGAAVAIAGVLAMVNEMNTDKTAESSMKQLQQEVKMMEERVKKEDASFELQVEVFEFSIMALDRGIAIARQKDSGYGMVLGMYGAAMAATAIEMAMGWWNPPMAACGAVNVGLSALGMATVGMIKGAIASGIADMERQRANIISIRDRFLYHFGGHGAVATQRNRPGLPGGDYAPNEVDPLAMRFNPGVASNRSASQQPVAPVANSSLPRSCATADNKPDPNCECQKSNSCLSLDSFMGNTDVGRSNAAMSALASSLPNDSLINETNQILRGELNAGDIGQAAINTRNQRYIANADKMLQSINAEKKKLNQEPVQFPDENDVFAFLEENKPSIKGQSTAASSSIGGIDLGSLLNQVPNLDKGLSEQLREIAESSDHPPGAGILPSFNFDAFDFGAGNPVSFKNQLTDMDAFAAVDANANAMMQGMSDNDPYDYSSLGIDVHKDKSLNIFHIISNRYNNLRMNNRLGGF
jgi:ribosomal protein L13E